MVVRIWSQSGPCGWPVEARGTGTGPTPWVGAGPGPVSRRKEPRAQTSFGKVGDFLRTAANWFRLASVVITQEVVLFSRVLK